MFSSVLLLLGLASISQCCKDNDMTYSTYWPPDLAYQVSVRHKRLDAHLCTGILIPPLFVLTVAQCFARSQWKKDDIKVYMGLNRNLLLNDTPDQISMVREIIVHKQHNTYLHDIALLVLSSSFVGSPRHYPDPKFPEQDEYVQDGYPATVSGFIELTNETNIRGANNMLVRTDIEYAQNHVRILDSYTCEKKYTIPDTQICTEDPCVNIKNCTENLGGPLILDGKVIGLLSQKASCVTDNHNIPAIFTRVSSYRNWFLKHMQNRVSASGTCPVGCQTYNTRLHG